MKISKRQDAARDASAANIQTLAISLKRMLQEARVVQAEAFAAAGYEDHLNAAHCHSRHESLKKQIRTMERDIAYAVMAKMESQS